MNRRTRLGLASLCGIIFLIALAVTSSGGQGTADPIFAFVFKLTAFLSALWLAWPNLIQIGRRLPPGMILIGAIGVVLLFAAPKLTPLILIVAAAYYGLWRVYLLFFPSALERNSPQNKPQKDR